MHRGLWRRPRRPRHWQRCERRQQRWRQGRRGVRVGWQDRKEAAVPWSIGTIPAFAWSVCGNHGKPQTGLPVPGFEPRTSRIAVRRITRLANCFGSTELQILELLRNHGEGKLPPPPLSHSRHPPLSYKQVRNWVHLYILKGGSWHTIIKLKFQNSTLHSIIVKVIHRVTPLAISPCLSLCLPSEPTLLFLLRRARTALSKLLTESWQSQTALSKLFGLRYFLKKNQWNY